MLQSVIEEADSVFAAATSEDVLLHAKARFLGKAGAVAALMTRMREIPPAERPSFGQAVNAAKDKVEELLQQNLVRLRGEARSRDLAGPFVDLTLPGRCADAGAVHPLRLVERKMLAVFAEMPCRCPLMRLASSSHGSRMEAVLRADTQHITKMGAAGFTASTGHGSASGLPSALWA
jgi:phenylalanyl-tRNA synthetase alpha subunit